MIFRPLLGADLSGSVAAITASHNRGGPYFRTRAIPVNPNTPFQQAVRGNMADLADLWVAVLTTAERDAWNTYALNVLIPNAIGEPRNIGGLGQYQRSNTPRLLVGLPRVDVAPTIFNIGGFTNPTIESVTAATDIVSIGFNTFNQWVDEDDSAMLIFTSRGQNESINFFKGPYRFAGLIAGDVALPPTSPADIALAFGVEVGQRLFVRINVTRADGRYATSFRDFGTAV